MLQEMIAEMEYIISKDYSNITGMVIMKTAHPYMNNTSMVTQRRTVSMFFRLQKAFYPF